MTDKNLEDMTREQLIQEIKALRENRDWYRDRVVWGFYEDEIPHYYQGKDGEHEINDPVTATLVNSLVKEVMKAQTGTKASLLKKYYATLKYKFRQSLDSLIKGLNK